MASSFLISPPVVEPLSLAQACSHLRLDVGVDDDYVKGCIAVARETIEGMTRRAMVKQKWRFALDSFPIPFPTRVLPLPGMSLDAFPAQFPQPFPPGFPVSRLIELPTPPLFMPVPDPLEDAAPGDALSITYIDENATWQTLDPSAYVLDAATGTARLEPVNGTAWPATERRIDAVRIDYWCGYTDGVPAPTEGSPQPAPVDGDPLNRVPAGLKQAMKLIIGLIYENREAALIAPGLVAHELPLGIKSLIAKYVVPRF